MKSNKPVIGILTNLLTVETGPFAGMERIYVNRDYVQSILRANATPILLPIIHDSEAMQQQIQAVDALILSGGQDVEPHHYQEEPSALLEAVCRERDIYEFAALKAAFEQQIPIFGVCRGLQLINVAFGGTLYQDIPHHFPESSVQHSQKTKRDEATHKVDIAQNSWLSAVFGKETLLTNSFHHQAIKKIAPGFQATAWAKDGIIEGIEKCNGGFVVAVQWHPEMMTEKHEDMHKLFCAFVHETIKRRAQN